MESAELEVKFFVNDLKAVEQRLKDLGACLVQPRTHEFNLRFDKPDGELRRTFRALRLRQDSQARLTYKGPAYGQDGVRVREELEFSVSDFGMARRFLQALGFQVFLTYEKYRTSYDLGEAHIALDELPYGSFVEIEGPNPPLIKSVNSQLGLDWQAAVPVSYTVLFDRLRVELNLPFNDLIFENFKDLIITSKDLQVQPADS